MVRGGQISPYVARTDLARRIVSLEREMSVPTPVSYVLKSFPISTASP